MRNKNIDTFYWVAKMGNFHAAAQRLNTTQSTVSARIRALEIELGFELFDRVGRLARLNTTGRQFLQYAEKFMSLSDQVQRAFAEKSSLHRTVRIGVSDTIASSWFMTFLHSANEVYPHVTFEMSSDTSLNITAQLLAYEIDVGFIVSSTGHANLVQRQICCYPWVWVASPRLSLPARRLTLSDLAEQTIVTFPRTTMPATNIEAELSKVSKHPKLHFASSANTMLIMAQKGWCLTVLLDVIVAAAIQRKELRPIETCLEFEKTQFVASYLAGPAAGFYEDLAEIAAAAAKRILSLERPPTSRRLKSPIVADR